MKIITNTLLVIIIFLLNGSSYSQIAVGQWREHFSYSKGYRVTETENKIYCATKGGFFSVDKSDNSQTERLSKASGLSDAIVTAITGDINSDLIVIGYENSNVDIINDGIITNIPDIKNKLITGNKSIFHINIIDDLAYLSCGFGIVVIDLIKKEIKDTYYIGKLGDDIEVYQTTNSDEYIYAATQNGIFKGEISNSNLVDYANWTQLNFLPNFNSKFGGVELFNDTLYTWVDNETYKQDTLYSFTENDTLWQLPDTNKQEISGLKYSNNNLLIMSKYGFYKCNTEGASSTISGYLGKARPKDAIYTTDKEYWIADDVQGLVLKNSIYSRIKLDGPLSTNIVKILATEGTVWSVPGGVDSKYTNLWNSGEVNIFEDQSWETINKDNTDGMSTLRDFVDIAIDPTEPGRFYVSSWGLGVAEFQDNNFVANYNDTTSTLQNIFGAGSPYVRTWGIAVDNNKNLWVTNSSVTNTLSVKKNNGDWVAFPYGSYLGKPEIGELIITQENHKWMVLVRGGGMFIFYENETIDDNTDDSYKRIDIADENGKIISNDIYSVTEDLNGVIWVGTNKGLVIYQNASQVFSGENFYGQQILIPRNDGTDNADILLGTETVNSIEVDGANRKWIGTQKSGAYLISSDGLEEVYHFTMENSPLPSNEIITIGIDELTGEVFFGTAKGIVSFKSTATQGNKEFTDVYAYPNPVKHGYEGVVTIKNLVTNSNVKITDVSGNIVFETTALGGQAIWDIKDFNGNRVQTGVYLAFCTNEDGSKSHITKILVIN